MKWKTWILAFGAFVAICLLADTALLQGIALRCPLSDGARIQRLYQDESDAIPIFGNSRARGNYNPAELGLRTYNYGMDGGSFEVTEMFLQIELAKPRTTPIIMELQYWDTGILGSPSGFIPFVPDLRIRKLLAQFHVMEWRYYVPGFRFFGYYDWFLQEYVNLWMHVEKADRGYREPAHPPPFSRAALDQAIRERAAYPGKFNWTDNQEQRLIADISGHPQRLFFLTVSPYHSSVYSNYVGADSLAAFEAKLSSLTNVVLLDWGRQSYPDELYIDTQHLRPEGTAMFSRKLGEKIRETLRERQLPIPAEPSDPSARATNSPATTTPK